MRYVSLRLQQDLVSGGVTRHVMTELSTSNAAELAWAQAGHPKKVVRKQPSSGKSVGTGRLEQKNRREKQQKFVFNDGEASSTKTGPRTGWEGVQLGPWTLPELGLETEDQKKERQEKLKIEEREKVMEEMRRYAPEAACRPVTGQYRQGPLAQLSTVMWTPLADDTSYVARDAAAMAAAYERAVDSMDPTRSRFFFVFVQDVRASSLQESWSNWTLVSQLATDASMAVDSRELARQLSSRVIMQLAKCTQWIRPDLILRRRPQFRIRLEEQQPFFQGLVQAVDRRRGVQHSPYFQRLYELLQISPSASLEEVEVQYRRLLKNDQAALWAHIFLENPSNPLGELPSADNCAQLHGSLLPPEEDVEEDVEFLHDGERLGRGSSEDDEGYDLEEAEESLDFEGDVALSKADEDWEIAEGELSSMTSTFGMQEEGNTVHNVALGPFDSLSLLRELHTFFVLNL